VSARAELIELMRSVQDDNDTTDMVDVLDALLSPEADALWHQARSEAWRAMGKDHSYVYWARTDPRQPSLEAQIIEWLKERGVLVESKYLDGIEGAPASEWERFYYVRGVPLADRWVG
jgi:hypothetical protein